MVNGRLSSRIDPLRSRVLAALALLALAVAAALASAPARAGADAGDGKKQAGSPANAAVGADQAPDRAARARVTASAAATAALATLPQGRIADYVAKNGTGYTFGSYLDANTGKIVVESDAPASVVASLTTVSQPFRPDGRRRLRGPPDHHRRRVPPPGRHPGVLGGRRPPSGSLCSTGYAVQNSAGTRFMVTAGHCYANGTASSPTCARSAPFPTGCWHSLGSRSTWSSWADSPTGTHLHRRRHQQHERPVVAAGSAFVNYSNYCHSGRTTGEQCGHTATSLTAQVCTQTGCKSPVIAYTGGTIQGGDSGGAFYAKDSNGGVWIRGHVIAWSSTTGYVEPWTEANSTASASSPADLARRPPHNWVSVPRSTRCAGLSG